MGEGASAFAWLLPCRPPNMVVVLAVWADGSSPYGWGVLAIRQGGSRWKGPHVLLLLPGAALQGEAIVEREVPGALKLAPRKIPEVTELPDLRDGLRNWFNGPGFLVEPGESIGNGGHTAGVLGLHWEQRKAGEEVPWRAPSAQHGSAACQRVGCPYLARAEAPFY